MAERAGEFVMHRGITADGSMIEIFVAPDESFTIVITGASRKPYRACIAMQGEAWRAIEPEPGLGDRL